MHKHTHTHTYNTWRRPCRSRPWAREEDTRPHKSTTPPPPSIIARWMACASTFHTRAARAALVAAAVVVLEAMRHIRRHIFSHTRTIKHTIPLQRSNKPSSSTARSATHSTQTTQAVAPPSHRGDHRHNRARGSTGLALLRPQPTPISPTQGRIHKAAAWMLLLLLHHHRHRAGDSRPTSSQGRRAVCGATVGKQAGQPYPPWPQALPQPRKRPAPAVVAAAATKCSSV